MLVVSPRGEAVEVRNAFGMAGRLAWACETCWYSSTGIMLMEAEAVDAQGRFYAKAGPIVRARDALRLADSAAVERWTLGSTGRDTVAFVATELTDQHRIIVGSAVHVNPRRRAFESRPEWAVSSDGWVAIVSVDPYRVSLVASDGTHIDGEPLAYDRVRVDDRLKDEWRERQQRSVPVTYVSATGESNVSVERRRPVEPEWPRDLPPFLPGAVRFGPGGNVWIHRAVAVGVRPIVDVVDHRGTRVAQLLLPAGRRLVGFGDAAVYAARIDEVNLEYLERYAMPHFPAQQ